MNRLKQRTYDGLVPRHYHKPIPRRVRRSVAAESAQPAGTVAEPLTLPSPALGEPEVESGQPYVS
jgi:hypothetical protein